MRGGSSRRRDSAASLEQADALCFASAAGGAGVTDALMVSSGGAAWQQQREQQQQQQQKLRYGRGSAAGGTAAAATSFSAERETSVVVAALGLLFCLSVCGCLFFVFLSLLFLCALDTFSLPLATKRAAGRASLAAALLHLAFLVVVGTLLHKQHPEESLRRTKSLLVSLGKRGGRAVLTTGGYMLIRGTRVARDCWLRMTHGDAAAAAAIGGGSTGSSSGMRNRGTGGTAAGAAAAALAGGATHLPYYSRSAAGCCNSSSSTACSSSSSSRLPPANHTTLHAAAAGGRTTDYDAFTNTKTRLTSGAGQLQQEHPDSMGCHAASYTRLSSSLPAAMAVSHSSNYGWTMLSASPSPSTSWDRLYPAAAPGGGAAAAGAAHRGDAAGGALIGKMRSVPVTSDSGSCARTRDSSSPDFITGSRRSGDATEAVRRSPSDDLLLLASPACTSRVAPNSVPPVVGMHASAYVAPAPAAVGSAAAAATRGPLLQQPAAASGTRLAAGAIRSDAPAPPATHEEGRHLMSGMGESSGGLARRPSYTSGGSSPHDVMRMQGVSSGAAAAFLGSGVTSSGSHSRSPGGITSADSNSGGLEGLWSNKSAALFQQQQVSLLHLEPEQPQQQQQAMQFLLQHSTRQNQAMQHAECTSQPPQVQHTVHQQRAQQMVQQQPFRQLQHAHMQISQPGLQNFQQSSYVAAAPLMGLDESVTPGLFAPAATAARPSSSSYRPADENVFAATSSVSTHKYMREPQQLFQAVPR